MSDSKFLKDLAFGQLDTDIVSNMLLKLNTGQGIRFSPIGRAVQVDTHYHQNGGSFFCLGEDCPACDYENPRTRFGFHVVEYRLEDEQAFTLLKPFSAKLRYLVFSNDKYPTFKQAYAANGGKVVPTDFTAVCIASQYAKWEINRVGEIGGAAYLKIEGAKEYVEKLFAEKQLTPEQIASAFGRERSKEFIARLYGQNAPGASEASAVGTLPEAVTAGDAASAATQLQDLLKTL